MMLLIEFIVDDKHMAVHGTTNNIDYKKAWEEIQSRYPNAKVITLGNLRGKDSDIPDEIYKYFNISR